MSSQYEYDPTRVSGSGEVTEGTAGAAIANRAACYLAADGRYYQADSDALATMPAIGLAMSAMTVGQKGEFLVKGFIGLSTWAWTTGSELYVSGTAGQLSHTAGAAIQQVGMAYSATQIFFNPSGYGAGAAGCGLLEGETAFVGFDSCKEPYTNYWLCDGVADDVQIQAAIDYVNTLGGGSILLERGTYSIDATLTIGVGNPVLLKGVGYDTHLQSTLGAAVVTLTINGAYSVVRNIYFSAQTGGNPHGIALGNIEGYVEISGCWFYDFRYCVWQYTNNSYSLIEGNKFESPNGQSCIVLEGSYATVSTNTFMNTAYHGVRALAAQNFEVTNNRFVDSNIGLNAGLSIYVENSATEGVENFIVEGNEILFTSNPAVTVGGIYISGGNSASYNCEYGVIANNVIDGNSHANIDAGIYLHGLSDTDRNVRKIDIVDNVVQGVNNAVILTYAEYLLCSNNTLFGVQRAIWVADTIRSICNDNQCEATNNYGINEAGTSDYNHFFGNDLTLCPNGVTIGGVNTKIPEIFVNTIDPLTTLGDHPVVTLADNATTNVYNSINLPLEFQQLVTAQLIVTPGGTGNMRWQLDTDFGKICANENYNAHSESVAANDTAVDLNQMECLDISTALTGIAAGDLIGFNFARIGAHANDTVNADCYYMGIRLRYV